MNTIKLFPLDKPVTAEISLPGSLSYTIRALAIAALTQGTVRIQNSLKSDDTYSMVKVLKNLGIEIKEEEQTFIVQGSISDINDEEYKLNIGISGRTARTILAILCVTPGIKILNCHAEFKKRPVKDLVDGLKQLGAKIEYLEEEGYLPVKVISSKLLPGRVIIKGNISSQYVSAIMMIAPAVGEITIEVLGEQSSKPFIDVTIDVMKAFGLVVHNKNYGHYKINGNQKYQNPDKYQIEPDATAASYFWAIAAVTKSKIKIVGLSPLSKQGDIQFADVLKKMGCGVEKNEEEAWISVEGAEEVHGIEIDMNNMPDTVQTLAVVAAFAKGKTCITGLSHLKVKETDRIEAPKNELIKMGIGAEANENSLTIEGGNPHGALIETYKDHRMAMAFAVAGAKIENVKIRNADVVGKSFRNFWNKLEEIGVGIKEERV